MRSRDRLRLGATVAAECGPDAGEREQRAIFIEREPRIPRSCWPGTKQRFSGLSHMHQCGEVVVRILVTGGHGDLAAACPAPDWLSFCYEPKSKLVSHSYPWGTKLRAWLGAFNMESARWENRPLRSQKSSDISDIAVTKPHHSTKHERSAR